jgi:hypothetical protein
MNLTICQLLIFVTYVTYITYRFGVLPSISESFYKLNEFRKGHFFTFFCFALSTTMVLESYKSSPLYFFSGVGLAFVGVATRFKWSGAHTNIVHYLGAFVGIVSALAALYFESGMWIPATLFAFITALIVLFKIKNATFWIEIVAFLLIITGLFLR